MQEGIEPQITTIGAILTIVGVGSQFPM